MILVAKGYPAQFIQTFYLCLFLSIIAGCELSPKPPEQVTISGPTMGTSYTIKLIPESTPFSKDKLHTQIKDRLKRINQLMSTYDSKSELSRFNRAKEGQWFSISKETLQVVETSISISEKSEGAFDFTVGGLVDLWGFGKKDRTDQIPSENEILSLLKTTGYKKVQVRSLPPAIRKRFKNIELDLSAIAKGFAVDEIAALLVDQGIYKFLVEIGGEIKTMGTKHNNRPWTVAVENPKDFERSVRIVLTLNNNGLATSGDYRNFFTIKGKRYSHTINPVTGVPAKHNLASVSVVHSSTMIADVWATAFMVMGPETGLKVAKREGLAVLFIVRTDTGFSDLMTDQFASYIVSGN